MAALGLWLYVSGLQSANADLKTSVRDLTAQRDQYARSMIVLGDELAAAEARAEFSASIKEEIYAIPPSETGVPADIRAALERLRQP